MSDTERDARRQSQRALTHQVSNISAVTDSGRTRDDAGSGAGPARGRPSLVSMPSVPSLQTDINPFDTSDAPPLPNTSARPSPTPKTPKQTKTYAGWAASTPFGGDAGAGGGIYSPVGETHPRHASAVDDEPQTSPRGNPPKSPKTRSDSIVDEKQEAVVESRRKPSVAPEPVFHDLSTVGGDLPWGTKDSDTASLFRREEASGKLTGGLGQGFQSNATLREAELLASGATPAPAPAPAQGHKARSMLTRAITVRAMLGRKPTVQSLGQIEANRRGEIVEVIMEEEAPPMPPPPHQRITPADTFDLSDLGGPLGDLKSGDFGMRTSTFPARQQNTQVFYPQPDWKPVVMRPLFLGILVGLSVGLAIGQEALYRAAAGRPLLVFQTPDEIPRTLYFAFKFLPTMISVTYGLLWSMTDFDVRRLEAFYQLSKEEGASAGRSINVDYITSFGFMRPVRALRCEHYAVFISSTASLMAISLIPTLVSASIQLSPDRHTRMENPLGTKAISINGVWSRILTVMLLVIAGLGSVLFYMLKTRKSGLLSDVKGIAGLASMAVVSHILTDFKDMDLATHQEIHQKLKKRRYVLRNSSLAPDDNNKPNSRSRTVDLDKENDLSENPHPFMLRAWGVGPLVVGIVLFIILIQVVLFTEATVITDQAPWVITALSVGIKMCWSGLDTDMRMMEPYYILWRRHALAKTLTLDYTAMPFGWVAIQGALNRHFLIFFVGLGTVMSEVLTVLATSLATVSGRDFLDLASKSKGEPGQTSGDSGLVRISSGQETVLSFWITHGITTFILMYMAATATAVLMLRRRPFLPRQPNTIASVLAFIHQSKMIYDFVGTSKLNTNGMAKKLEEGGKTYGVGWFQGRDGLTHCGVDQEELSSDYKPGYDYSKANQPWLASQEWLL